MKRQLVVLLLALAVVASAFADRSFGRGAFGSNGNQHCKRPGQVTDLPQSKICVDPCAPAIIDALVTRRSEEVNPRCIASTPTTQTPVTAKVTNADGTGSLAATLQAGFAPGHGPGVYSSGPFSIWFRVFPAGTSAADGGRGLADGLLVRVS